MAPSGTGSPSVSPASPSSSSPTPSVSESVAPPSGDPAAVALYTQAMTALEHASSVRVTGDGEYNGGPMAIDLSFVPGKGVTGTVGLGGGTMRVLAIGGTTYLELDRQALLAFGGDIVSGLPSQVLSAIAGKWIKFSAGASSQLSVLGDLAELSSLPAFTRSFAPSGKLTLRPGTSSVNGQNVTTLVEDGGGDPSQGGIMQVLAGGDHRPVRVGADPDTGAGVGRGTLNFVDYGKPVTLDAPAGAVDFSQLLMLIGPGSASPSA